MKKSLILLTLLVPLLLNGQSYHVSLIPDSLLKDSRAVKRFEELRVIIKSPSKAVVRHKYAITILNEEGARFAPYTSFYSKFRTINNIDGKVFDASGKEVRSVKKKDISDMSYDDEMSLISDARFKRHSFNYPTYPYTVEYEDEEEYEGIFSLPQWIPVSHYKFAVQHSRFVVETPADYKIRFKQLNIKNEPVTKTDSKTSQYAWELKNVTSYVSEPFEPAWDEITPNVLIAPTQFEYGGYPGEMSSWANLGKFIGSLYVGRDELPESVKADVHQLTDKLSSKNEKITALYEYMQKNTRYIGIQLGIGGFQPFPAKEVAEKKYGDCKALSNFMVSLLKEAGIKANNVIIYAGEGERGLWDDFPANYFNHVVACVPDGKDTLWLECTSQTASAGYMGSSTGNRKALMLGEDGGRVVSTPAYKKDHNQQLRKINAVIDAEGNLLADIKTHFTGQQQELQHQLIHEATPEQRTKFLNSTISLATYKVEKSEYKERKGNIPVVDEYLQISAPNFASVTGKRLFITPNMFNKTGNRLSTDEPRRYDIAFKFPYRDVDTIQITIPEGYQPEAIPKDVSLQTKFGNYSMNFVVKGNQLNVLRVSEINGGLYPAEEYAAVAKYFADIYKADRSRVILVKKDG